MTTRESCDDAVGQDVCRHWPTYSVKLVTRSGAPPLADEIHGAAIYLGVIPCGSENRLRSFPRQQKPSPIERQHAAVGRDAFNTHPFGQRVALAQSMGVDHHEALLRIGREYMQIQVQARKVSALRYVLI